MDYEGNISNNNVINGIISSGSIDMNYEKLKNKPSINGVELIGNKTSEDLGIGSSFEEIDPTVPQYVKDITEEDISKWNNKSDFSGNYNDLTDKPVIPSKTSELVNDSAFVTENTFNDEINTINSKLDSIDTKIGNISVILSTLTTVSEVN